MKTETKEMFIDTLRVIQIWFIANKNVLYCISNIYNMINRNIYSYKVSFLIKNLKFYYGLR